MEIEILRNLKTALGAQLEHIHENFGDNEEQFQVLHDVNTSLVKVNTRLVELEASVAHRLHTMGRIVANFQPNLVLAPFLEVNDIRTATYARFLHDVCGWRGAACFHENLPELLQFQINDVLEIGPVPVPLPVYVKMDDAGFIVLVPWQVHLQNQNQNQ